MSARGRKNEGQGDCTPGTLGDLLYADKAKTLVSEKEWVGLVQSIGAGDQLALRALYGRTHHLVFTLMMRITNNRETAEELTLDVFHDVWRRAKNYDAAGGSVVGWMLNLARSRAIDRVRFEQRKKRVNSHGDSPLPATTANDCDEALELSEQSRLLRNALAVLTPEQRLTIETAFFSELSHGEVAARLNQPLGTVKTRIRSALEKLRQTLRTGGRGP
jgi:RNA polymerase sigma-70 factor (ECF subfamily)